MTATRPATQPDNAPSSEGLPFTIHSTNIHDMAAAAVATGTETDGKASKVKASSLAFSGDEITLENGQSVKFARITKVAAAPVTDGVKLTLTLVTGKTVAGTVNKDLPFTGDADGGPLSVIAGSVKSITIDRG